MSVVDGGQGSDAVEMYMPCDALDEFIGVVQYDHWPPVTQMALLRQRWDQSRLGDAALKFLPGGSRLWSICLCLIALIPRLAPLLPYAVSGVSYYWGVWLYLGICCALTTSGLLRKITRQRRWRLLKFTRTVHMMTFLWPAAYSITCVFVYPNTFSRLNQLYPTLYMVCEWSLWVWISQLVFTRLMHVATGAPGTCFFSSGELKANFTILSTAVVQCAPLFALVRDDGVASNEAPEFVISHRSLLASSECALNRFLTKIGMGEILCIL